MREKQIRNIRVVDYLEGVFQSMQPQPGRIYKAEYFPAYGEWNRANGEFCIIEVNGKRIALRKGEYELVGD